MERRIKGKKGIYDTKNRRIKIRRKIGAKPGGDAGSKVDFPEIDEFDKFFVEIFRLNFSETRVRIRDAVEKPS